MITFTVVSIGVIVLGLALAALADRSACAAAWRQIALERRWTTNITPTSTITSVTEPSQPSSIGRR